jgi:hypothetical protein
MQTESTQKINFYPSNKVKNETQESSDSKNPSDSAHAQKLGGYLSKSPLLEKSEGTSIPEYYFDLTTQGATKYHKEPARVKVRSERLSARYSGRYMK